MKQKNEMVKISQEKLETPKMTDTSTNTPSLPTTFPASFGTGQRMLHSRIAIWSHLKNDFQIYEVNREAWPAIHLIPTTTERSNAFHFAEGPGCRQSRAFTLYRPRARVHTHVDMAIWHTGGWLCRKNATHMVPVLPILAVSDPAKLPWETNVGLHKTREYEDWLQFQTPFFYRPILQNRMQPVSEVRIVEKKTEMEPIPLFVAEALLEKASDCPISMEPLKKGEVAATSCFHLFQRDALETWRQTNDTCPVCKKTCAITNC
jgi:hypothetical protein